MSERSPCVRCGMILHTGEGRITVSLTVDELVETAWALFHVNPRDRKIDRLLCAAGLLDEDRERTEHSKMNQARVDANDWSEPHA